MWNAKCGMRSENSAFRISHSALDMSELYIKQELLKTLGQLDALILDIDGVVLDVSQFVPRSDRRHLAILRHASFEISRHRPDFANRRNRIFQNGGRL